MRSHLFATALLAGTFLGAPAFAEVTIAWPQEAGLSNTANPRAVLGAPDGNVTVLGEHVNAWALKFATAGTYGNLEKLLGMAPGELSNWDIIAFEGQNVMPAPGAPMQGWESSMWFVADQQHAVAAVYDENAMGPNSPDSGVRFRSGTVTGGAYSAVFGSPDIGAMSWILIKLPTTLDKHSKTFGVWVSGVMLGQGSPDVDAIGVIQ